MTEEKHVLLTTGKNGVLISVRVTPRGRRNGISGVRNGILLISVTAPPADGAANEAVIEVLRAALACPKSAVSLWRGHKSRDKVIAVSAIEPDDIQTRLKKFTGAL